MHEPIKFRAWHKAMKYMSPVGDLHLTTHKTVFMYLPSPGGHEDTDVDWSGQLVLMDDVELMQFTGFLDKNGKAIYESDIVRGDQGNHIGYVEWDHEWGAWIVEWTQGMSAGQILGRVLPVEVIGNVYEHPNLLKK
jgi:uncharacterized phage protein (TIGR01671 family)